MHYVRPEMEVIIWKKANIVTNSLINGGVGDGNVVIPGEGGVDAPEDDWG